ncbi:uncharacterized protein TNCV_1012261 [Trichonephila clavipes]|uniref:Uncharacterized protein n=1 Tax=Trichonephila clavipes TaxID=2585209 RepID=A0A8X6VX49_TRICX|nr:uncharacterized protein TNCV_1012261 [Trichonephila clavipes]
MNKIRRTPYILDCLIVSSEEFITVGDDNVCTPLFMADKDNLEHVQSTKNKIYVYSDDENEMNKAALVTPSYEMRNIMKKYGIDEDGNAERSQRLSITSSREDRHVIRMALIDRAATSRALSQDLGSFSRQQLSARKVRRLCCSMDSQLGDHSYGYTWCCITDRSAFNGGHQDRRIHVHWHSGERTLAACIRQRHTGPTPGMMV